MLALIAHNFTGDGRVDVLLGGNVTHTRLRIGQAIASDRILLKNVGHGQSQYVPQPQSGLAVSGNIRSLLCLPAAGARPRIRIGLTGKRVTALETTL